MSQYNYEVSIGREGILLLVKGFNFLSLNPCILDVTERNCIQEQECSRLLLKQQSFSCLCDKFGFLKCSGLNAVCLDRETAGIWLAAKNGTHNFLLAAPYGSGRLRGTVSC